MMKLLQVHVIIVAALVATQSATAQNTEKFEEIVVTGYRGSLERAIDIKRNSDQIVDAISAEDIGKLPDENVAESLQRIAGVSISRSKGEGQFVAIRGLDRNFVVSTFNNRILTSGRVGTIGFSNNGGGAREFGFDIFPSELVSGIEVYKTPKADQISGGIGGVVNIKSLRPLETGKKVAGSIAGSYSELAETVDPRVAFLVSDTFADDRIGAALTVTYTERTVREDRYFNFSHTPGGLDIVTDTALFNTGDGVVDLEGAWPLEFVPFYADEERERLGLTGTIQYANENLSLDLDVLYSHFTNERFETGLFNRWHNLSVGSTVPFGGALVVTAAEVASNGSLLYAERPSGELRNTGTETGLETDLVQVGGKLEWTDGAYLTVTGDVSYTSSTSDLRFAQTAFSTLADIVFDARGGSGLPRASYGVDITDPSIWAFSNINLSREDVRDDLFDARFDLELAFGGNILQDIDVGVRFSNRELSTDRFFSNPGTSVFGTPTLDTIGTVPFPVSDLDFGAGSSASAMWAVPDINANLRAFDLSTDSLPVDAGGTFAVTEQIVAGYIQADFEGDLGSLPYSANIGVRVVRTNTDSTGNFPTLIQIDSATDVTIESSPVEFSETYTELLPSANFRIDLSEDTVLRLAASKTLTRPNLLELAPNTSVNSTTLQGDGGNPELEPFTAWSFDASFEWYLGDAGLVSAGLFYKDVGGFTFQQSFTGNDAIIAGQQLNVFSRPVNAASAEITGVELGFQKAFTFLPAPFDALGVQLNYTYADSSTEFDSGFDSQGRTFTFTGISEHTANAVLFYESDRVSTRLAYNYRSDFIDNPSFIFDSVSTDAFGQLDGSFSWKVNDNYNVFVEGINLTDEPLYRFSGTFENRAEESGFTGRRIFFGVRAVF